MIRIITDSASDLPKDIINRYNIEILPLEIIVKTESFKEGVDITREDIINYLNQDIIPTTSQVKPFVFDEIYNKYKEDDLIVITMSSDLSGTYNSAVLSTHDIEKNRRIEIIDSRSVSLGEGKLVIDACKMVEQGMGFDDIVKAIYKKRDKVKCIAIIDTLKYLYKGGRISKTSYAIGSMLGLKIVITIEHGKVEVLGKERGNRKAIKLIKEHLENKKIYMDKVYGFSSGVKDKEYDIFKGEFTKEITEYIESNLCSSLTIHGGPNTYVVFVEE